MKADSDSDSKDDPIAAANDDAEGEDTDQIQISDKKESDGDKNDVEIQPDQDSFDDFEEPKEQVVIEEDKTEIVEEQTDQVNDEPTEHRVDDQDQDAKDDDSDFDDFAEPVETPAPQEPQEVSKPTSDQNKSDGDSFDDFEEPQEAAPIDAKEPSEPAEQKSDDSGFDDFKEPEESSGKAKEETKQSENDDSDFDDFAEPEPSPTKAKPDEDSDDSGFGDFEESKSESVSSPQPKSPEKPTTDLKKSIFTSTPETFKSDLSPKLLKISPQNIQPNLALLNSLKPSKSSSTAILKPYSTCQLFERKSAQSSLKNIQTANLSHPYKFTLDTVYKPAKVVGKNMKSQSKNDDQILDLDFETPNTHSEDFEMTLADTMKSHIGQFKWDQTWASSKMQILVHAADSQARMPSKQAKNKRMQISNDDFRDETQEEIDQRDVILGGDEAYMSPDEKPNAGHTPKKGDQDLPKVPDEPTPFFEGWDHDAFNKQASVGSSKGSPERQAKPSTLVTETFKEFGLDNFIDSKQKNASKGPENTDSDDWVEAETAKRSSQSPAAEFLMKLPDYAYLSDLNI